MAQSFTLSDGVIELRFADSALHLKKKLMPALSHLSMSLPVEPRFHFQIDVDVALPERFKTTDLSEGIYLTRDGKTGDTSFAVQWSDGIKVFFDFDANHAQVVWQKPVENHEAGAPFRFIFSWILRRYDCFLIHAAGLLAPNGKTALLIGPGGSGKSTLTLAALVSKGWKIFGDDYVVLSGESPSAFHAHTLYSSGKLTDSALSRESIWDAIHDQCVRLRYEEKEKWIYFLGERFKQSFATEAQIDCLIYPIIDKENGAASRFSPLRPTDCLKKIAPSTLFQNLMPEPAEFHALSKLVKSVPGFEWRLGGHSLENIYDLENQMAII